MMVGGRLGYVIFYRPDLLLEFSSQIPFWGLLRINEGGMASHGGILGIVVACYVFGRKHKISFRHLCDLTTLGGGIGIFCGRMANFVNGELVGRQASKGFAFTVKFPQDIFSWSYRKMRVLDDVVVQVGVPEKQWQDWLSGRGVGGHLKERIYETLDKVVLGIQSGNVELQNALAPYLVARYPSQLIAGFLEGMVVFCLLLFIWRKPQKPGIIGSWFLIFYSIMRIFNEQFRMPDTHLGFQALGLTRGQWLSVGMLLIGLILVYVWGKANTESLGGWSKKFSKTQ